MAMAKSKLGKHKAPVGSLRAPGVFSLGVVVVGTHDALILLMRAITLVDQWPVSSGRNPYPMPHVEQLYEIKIERQCIPMCVDPEAIKTRYPQRPPTTGP